MPRNTVRVKCSSAQCCYNTNRSPCADYGLCPRCGAALERSGTLAEYQARQCQGRRAARVKCYACGFETRRLERPDGSFGACSDCAAPLARYRPRAEYIASGDAREQAAEAAAARMLRELHNPILKVRRYRKAKASIMQRFGASFFSHIARFPKHRRKKGNRNHAANV